MYNQLIFYNHFGAGDIFESREFVKEWMRLVPAHLYCYAHGKNESIIKDIPEIKFKEVTEHMDPMRGVWDDLNGNLYINTWIGRDGQYVLPGIGCTVEQLYRMHNDMLRVYNLGQLSRQPVDYIPNIDFSYYDTKSIDSFLSKIDKDIVLISNGQVQSLQAENFDLTPIIVELTKRFPDKIFVATEYKDIQDRPVNLFFTNEIIKTSNNFDLNEVAYLSTFCKYIVGRSSGPFTFCQTYDNCMDATKSLISLTYRRSGASFVENTDVKIKKYWSGLTSFEGVVGFLSEVLR